MWRSLLFIDFGQCLDRRLERYVRLLFPNSRLGIFNPPFTTAFLWLLLNERWVLIFWGIMSLQWSFGWRFHFIIAHFCGVGLELRLRNVYQFLQRCFFLNFNLTKCFRQFRLHLTVSLTQSVSLGRVRWLVLWSFDLIQVVWNVDIDTWLLLVWKKLCVWVELNQWFKLWFQLLNQGLNRLTHLIFGLSFHLLKCTLQLD